MVREVEIIQVICCALFALLWVLQKRLLDQIKCECDHAIRILDQYQLEVESHGELSFDSGIDSFD